MHKKVGYISEYLHIHLDINRDTHSNIAHSEIIKYFFVQKSIKISTSHFKIFH